MKRLITIILLLTALSLGGLAGGLYAEEPAKPAAPAAEQAKPTEPAPAPATPTHDPAGTIAGGAADLAGGAANAPTAEELKTLDKKEPMLAKVADVVGHNRIAINIMWTLITGFLVMFMQAGFAMVETGFCRAKNAAHTMAMNFMVYAIGVTGFLICGFSFMFGGVGQVGALGMVANLNHEYVIHLFGKDFGIIGLTGFFLDGISYDVSVFTLFLFQVVFMDTAATIPTGAMAERWKFTAFIVYGFFISMLTYPIFGNWVWGGGWLSQLGTNFGLGHGVVDFAGSGVVHMVGGVTALAGAIVLGPRIGKYRKDGTPVAIPGHHIPMAIIGTFILAFGWFGFNPGSTLAGTDLRIGIVATNTMIASAAGAVAAMVVMWLKFGKPDPSMMANGMLAGLVAITAPCAFVDAKSAFLIGLIAGVLVVFSVFFVERKLKVDDPVGAVSVHGTCGAWGVLSLGIFADGKYGDGWNGVKGTVTGLLHGDASQLLAQVVDVGVLFVFIFALSWLFFKVLDKIIGIRVAPEVELEGLDVPEVGVSAYPDFIIAKHPSEM